MRTILPLCGGGGGGDDEEEHHSHHRSRAGWMKRLPWVRSSHCVAVHTDTEPGVWLRSFHSLDTDGQNEVRPLLNVLLSLRTYHAGFTSKDAARSGIMCFFCGMSHNFDQICTQKKEKIMEINGSLANQMRKPNLLWSSVAHSDFTLET